MSDKWFYKVADQEIGPLSGQQLKQLADEKRLAPTDPVRRENDPNWHLAQQVKGLFPVQAADTTPKSGEATKRIRVARAIVDTPSQPIASGEISVKMTESGVKQIPQGIPVGTAAGKNPQAATPVSVSQNADFPFAFNPAPAEAARRPHGAKLQDDASADPAAIKKKKQQKQFYIMAGVVGGLAMLGIIVIMINMFSSSGDTQKTVGKGGDTQAEKPAENVSEADFMKSENKTPEDGATQENATASSAEKVAASAIPSAAAFAAMTAEEQEEAAKKAKYADATKAKKYGEYGMGISGVLYEQDRPKYLKFVFEVRHPSKLRDEAQIKTWNALVKKITCKTAMGPTAKSLEFDDKNFRVTKKSNDYEDVIGLQYQVAFRAPDGLPKTVFLEIPGSLNKNTPLLLYISQREWGVVDGLIEEGGTGPEVIETDDSETDEVKNVKAPPMTEEEIREAELKKKYAVDDDNISDAERERRQVMMAGEDADFSESGDMGDGPADDSLDDEPLDDGDKKGKGKNAKTPPAKKDTKKKKD